VSVMAGPAWAEGGHSEQGDTGAEGHGDHHVPHFSDINWFTGFLGEKEDVEPGLLWRSPGTPIPLGALIFNTAILFFLIGRFGGPGIKKGLVDRKRRIADDIERAAKMRAEAEAQLAHFEDKLKQMGAEMKRIKAEMKQQAELDRAKLVAEAKERRATIEAEARTLIQQELAQARYDATVKAVSAAVEAARQEIKSGLAPADHERLANEFSSSLSSNMKSKGVSS
jgi:F-type H+-transporting ATPase subunit b